MPDSLQLHGPIYEFLLSAKRYTRALEIMQASGKFPAVQIMRQLTGIRKPVCFHIYIILAVEKQFALRRFEAFLIFAKAVWKTRVHSPKIYPDTFRYESKTSKQPKSHTAAFSWFPCRSRAWVAQATAGHVALGIGDSGVFTYVTVCSDQ